MWAHLAGEAANKVIVDACTQGTEEVDGLAGERVHKLLDLLLAQLVVFEDALAHSDAVGAGRVPIVLLHAAVTDKGGIQRAEVVS